MYTKKNYGFWLTFKWSKMPFIYGLLYAGLVSGSYFLLNKYLDINIAIAWQPISLLGIAVAFYLGFKNNASYDRTWEARKIWGGIVNSSRTFGVAVNAFIQGPDKEAVKKKLIYRHIAWLTALRFQLRLAKEWEHTADRIKGVYYPETTDKYFENLDAELCRYLEKSEAEQYLNKTNVAAQILKTQSLALQELRNQNYFDDFRHIEFHRLISSFYDDQGRSERIKNFPFPRQYASAALWQTMIFAALIPFGILSAFSDQGTLKILLTIPISALLIWSFFLMEKIGDYSENPFEGSYNDIPITSISRAIEIDLREMIGDDNIPPALKSENGFLM
jgi:ion channel-forming bestrophin family protein